MRIIVSAIFWMVGIFLTVALYIAMLFFTVILYPFDRKRKVAHAQCYWWSDILTHINPYWKIRVVGLENIDRTKNYVIVVNHQSMADIIILYQIKTQFKWVAKESLFKVPFVGWSLSLAKHIRLKRQKFSSIKKVYREAVEWLRAGVSVLFFPEGTRSETDQMNEFLNGAFKLAIKEHKPILPIVLSGTGNAIPKGSWVFGTRVFCTLKVLPPIDTASFSISDFEKLNNLTRKTMDDAAA